MTPKSRRLPDLLLILGVLAILAAGLTGCNAAPAIESSELPADGGLSAVNGGANVAIFDAETYRLRTSGQLYQTDVTSKGASTFGESPSGVASVIKGDLNLTNAQDVSFERLAIEYQDAVATDDGTIVTPLRSIELVGFNGAGSPLIAAGVARLAVHAEYAATLSGDAKESYLEWVRQVAGPATVGLVRSLEAAVSGGLSALVPPRSPVGPPSEVPSVTPDD